MEFKFEFEASHLKTKATFKSETYSSDVLTYFAYIENLIVKRHSVRVIIFEKKKINILIYNKELLIRFDVKPYLLGMLKTN